MTVDDRTGRSGCQDPMALAYGEGRSPDRSRRRGREAEGDGLLNRYRGNPIVGSNPTVSASYLSQTRNGTAPGPENPVVSEGFKTDIPADQLASGCFFSSSGIRVSDDPHPEKLDRQE